MNYQRIKEYDTKIRFGLFLNHRQNTVNDVKIIICEQTWKSKYYILQLKEDENIMKKHFL